MPPLTARCDDARPRPMTPINASPAEALRAVLAATPPTLSANTQLHLLVHQGLDRLPLPGRGATRVRWQALAVVAEHDLSLAKLYEGHTDALAILAELGVPDEARSDDTWGVWASEGRDGRVVLEPQSSHTVTLQGTKHWCSGASQLSHGLLTAWHRDGAGPQLVAVAMEQPAVAVDASSWQAVGMAGSASVDVSFNGALARTVGDVGAYLARPGFWQGGAGIAACWLGGATAIAAALHRQLLASTPAGRSAFQLAALGRIDLHLESTGALLREAAQWIDRYPIADASAIALRVRLAAEAAARHVLDEAGRALGATPFCRDAQFARMAADLAVFVRQSHAERDFVELAERLFDPAHSRWKL